MDERTERNGPRQRTWSRRKNSLHRFVPFEERESLVLKLRRSKPVCGPRHNLLAPEVLDPRKAGRIDGVGAGVRIRPQYARHVWTYDLSAHEPMMAEGCGC